MFMDKLCLKQTMLDLEKKHLDASREDYLAFVSSARIDRSEPVENDEQAQAELASDLSEAFNQPVQAHADKIARLQRIDFGPKEKVAEGAIVKLMGRCFVVAVATDRFACEGIELMGISAESPLFRSLEGKSAGDRLSFNGRTFVIESVR